MNAILGVFKREFRAYFNSPIAYVYITVFLAIVNWFFFRDFFLMEQATLRGFLEALPVYFLFFVPAVSMRLWSEERKLGTVELLLTLPVKDHEVVLGKFLAGLALLAVSLVLTFPLVITVKALGNPDMGAIFASYLGGLLLGAAYLAIGFFVSSLTENQIVAFILGISFCFAFFIVGENLVLLSSSGFLVPILKFLGLGTHFQSIARGVLDSRDLIYYLSLIGFFLFLNVRSVAERRWA
jgi:ABC-2 type transport system permease protein